MSLPPLTIRELQVLISQSLADGTITPETPVAISTDPEGNQARQIGSFGVEKLADTRWGVVWDYEAPKDAVLTKHFVLWPI